MIALLEKEHALPSKIDTIPFRRDEYFVLFQVAKEYMKVHEQSDSVFCRWVKEEWERLQDQKNDPRFRLMTFINHIVTLEDTMYRLLKNTEFLDHLKTVASTSSSRFPSELITRINTQSIGHVKEYLFHR
ncbi:hypothetical protein BGX31_010135 [Mortierella sp. GBA43]|nr:hypothetical protein BGX31_010135 [Mortierella sp. GBA43]